MHCVRSSTRSCTDAKNCVVLFSLFTAVVVAVTFAHSHLFVCLSSIAAFLSFISVEAKLQDFCMNNAYKSRRSFTVCVFDYNEDGKNSIFIIYFRLFSALQLYCAILLECEKKLLCFQPSSPLIFQPVNFRAYTHTIWMG